MVAVAAAAGQAFEHQIRSIDRRTILLWISGIELYTKLAVNCQLNVADKELGLN
jgi:hypothetical protein